MRKCSFLILFTLFLSIIPTHVIGTQGSTLTLSETERAWLEKHPEVTLGFTADHEPLIIVNEDGSLSGMLIDIYAELEKVTGLKVNFQIDKWAVTIQKVKDGKLDGLAASAHALADSLGLFHSKVLLYATPTVFAKREATFQINGIQDLTGKKISVLKGTKVVANALAPFKDQIDVVETDSALKMLMLAYEGKVDAAFGISFHNYLVGKHLLFGLQPFYSPGSFLCAKTTQQPMKYQTWQEKPLLWKTGMSCRTKLQRTIPPSLF